MVLYLDDGLVLAMFGSKYVYATNFIRQILPSAVFFMNGKKPILHPVQENE